jgi:NADH:ubiquinone oxidoreductase subunit 4 (chain M)
MVLTGVLSKMGVYGFVRLLLPLFPNEIKVIGPWLLALVVCRSFSLRWLRGRSAI